jgi:hypothetical protein
VHSAGDLDIELLLKCSISLGHSSDEFIRIFSTTVDTIYECQRCLESTHDEQEGVCLLPHPFEDYFHEHPVPEANCLQSGCEGRLITSQRSCPQGYASILMVSGPMTYDDVNEYDQRGILEGSLRNEGDGPVWRVMIGVLYENADQRTAIAARFTDAGVVYSPDQDHQAQLARHDGFLPRLVCFGPAEPTLAQRDQKPAQLSTDVALAQTLGDLAWLHDRSTAMMHPTLLDELHRAWLKSFDR